MIKSIDEITCINCGLCESVCVMDIFRSKEGKVYIAYHGDCCNCLRCLFVCPVDAITITPGIPKKYDGRPKWKRVKEMLGVK